MKRHSPQEIAAALKQAQAMEAEGVSQRKICETIGISVMTLHRWRALKRGFSARATEIMTENARLKAIAATLLLQVYELRELLGSVSDLNLLG
jgi:transposase-like protein